MIFQLTSSRRGWRYVVSIYFIIDIFQLTSSRRGWPPLGMEHSHPKHFNSHPHEEDDCFSLTFTHEHEYFNSHPHEEDDDIFYGDSADWDISTHILTKRMTKMLTNSYKMNNISTHILTKRMTQQEAILFCIEKFQLTSSRRGWLATTLLSVADYLISTHILTKRMTSLHCSPFSPRTFQLTSSRRGWRRYGEYVDMDNQYFNSHPHEEDDSVSRFLNPSLYISTHILTKRMTTQPILSSTRY